MSGTPPDAIRAVPAHKTSAPLRINQPPSAPQPTQAQPLTRETLMMVVWEADRVGVIVGVGTEDSEVV